MNKLFSKIAALSVGLAMAVGVGVAVNAGSSRVEKVKAATTLAATFNCGADGSASHADGSSATSYEETDGSYTLSISNGTKFYTGARDATGNGCFKFGTSSAVGSMSFTVPSDVVLAKIYVAGYKANTAKISINSGTTQTISTPSNNGEYTAVDVDTSSSKTVSFTTVSGGVRAMINKIEFYVNEVDPGKKETSVTITNSKPLNMLITDDPVQLNVTTSPANLELSYVSSNNSVVTVSNTGLVTAQGLGSASITVSFAGDDEYSSSNDTINVTVTRIEPEHVSGMTISQIVAATTETTPVLVYEIEGYVTAWSGTNTDGTQYGNFYIADAEGDTTNQAYVYGANYGNGCVWDGMKYTFQNNKTFLTNEVTSQIVIGSKITAEFTAFKYNNTTFEFQGEILTVENPTSKELVSIEVTDPKTEYTVGDEFVKPVVTAHYDDDSSKPVTNSASFSGYDLSVAGEQTVEVSYKENEITKETSYTITVSAPVTATYRRLTVSSLVDYTGDYLIVCEDEGLGDSPVAFDGSLDTLDAASNNVAVAINDDTIELVDTHEFHVAKKVGGFSIQSDSGKYIGKTADSNGIDENTSDNYTNSISYSDNDDSDGVMNVSGSGGAYLRYNSASGNNRFRFFKSSTYTGQKAISLFMKVSPAESLALDILNDTNATCAAYVDGETHYDKTTFADVWTALALKYNALDSEDQAVLVGADADKNGVMLEAAMARYDFLCAKYGLDNFMTGRTLSYAVTAPRFTVETNDNNMMIIIVVISSATVLSLGVLLALKKKKHN